MSDAFLINIQYEMSGTSVTQDYHMNSIEKGIFLFRAYLEYNWEGVGTIQVNRVSGQSSSLVQELWDWTAPVLRGARVNPKIDWIDTVILAFNKAGGQDDVA